MHVVYYDSYKVFFVLNVSCKINVFYHSSKLSTKKDQGGLPHLEWPGSADTNLYNKETIYLCICHFCFRLLYFLFLFLFFLLLLVGVVVVLVFFFFFLGGGFGGFGMGLMCSAVCLFVEFCLFSVLVCLVFDQAKSYW